MIRLLVHFTVFLTLLGITHFRVLVPVNEVSLEQPENNLCAYESTSFNPIENPSQQGDIRVLKHLITKTRSFHNPNRYVTIGSDADGSFNTFRKGFCQSCLASSNFFYSSALPIYIRQRKLII